MRARGTQLLLLSLSLLILGCGGGSNDDITEGDASPDGGDREPDGSNEEVTPIYVSFYSHNEEGDYWENLVTDEGAYQEYRADLIARIRLLHEHGVRLNWETDHSTLRAMAAHESGDLLETTAGKNILRWMVEDMDMVVDPHGHLTTYNYADLAYLIEELGVTPSGVVGGFMLIECGEEPGEVAYADWEQVIELEADGLVRGRRFPDATWEPTVLAQPAMVGHAQDEFSSGVWRPGSVDEFLVHQPEGQLVVVGQGYPHDRLNLGEQNSGGIPVLYESAGYVHELAAMIEAGDVPADGFYTASIHLRDTISLIGVESTFEGLRQTLDALAPLVASGQVVYLDYEAVVELWESEHNGESSRLEIDRFSIFDEIMEGFEESCAGSTPSCVVNGCQEGEVCVPELDRCVVDCRLAGCPEALPSCDQTTGLCSDQGSTDVDSELLTVTNPESGVEWWVQAFFPSDASPEQPYPAVVIVPGGSGAGSASVEIDDDQRNPQRLAENGWITVTFDADGRGFTAGEEDYCGFIHQAGLSAVIEATAALPYVDRDRIGLFSGSYGITMASGVLARYPDLPVKFLVDFEGPADRNDTGHCDADDTGHITHVDCDDDLWWSEREAATFIMDVQVPYLRIQNARDHAQPDNTHVILMINNATSREHGGQGVSPWTRVNTSDMNASNSTYTFETPPQYFETGESFDITSLWTEMMNLVP